MCRLVCGYADKLLDRFTGLLEGSDVALQAVLLRAENEKDRDFLKELSFALVVQNATGFVRRVANKAKVYLMDDVHVLLL